MSYENIQIGMPAIARIQINLPTTVQIALENLWLKDNVINVSCPYPATFKDTLTYVVKAIHRINFVPFANSGDYQENASICCDAVKKMYAEIDQIVNELIHKNDLDNLTINLTERYKLPVPLSIFLSVSYEANDTLGMIRSVVETIADLKNNRPEILYKLTGSRELPAEFVDKDYPALSSDKKLRQLYNTFKHVGNEIQDVLKGVTAADAEYTRVKTWIGGLRQATDRLSTELLGLETKLHNQRDQHVVGDNVCLWTHPAEAVEETIQCNGYVVSEDGRQVDTMLLNVGLVIEMNGPDPVVEKEYAMIKNIESLANQPGGKSIITVQKLIRLKSSN